MPNSNRTRRARGIVMLSFPAPETLKDAITRMAQKEGLTRSSWIRLRLRECIDRPASRAKRPTQA